MKYLLCILTVAALLNIFANPQQALSHASGISFEQVVGEYRVDIGYDPAALVVGETDVFDFALFNAATGEILHFDELWVRMVHDGRTILATGLRESAFGRTTLLYVFPYPGEYAMQVSFRKDGETIAETLFPFSVSKQDASLIASNYAYLAVGSLFGACLAGVVLWRKRRSV